MIFYIKTVEEFGLHKELGKVTQGEGIRVGKMTKVCKILEWRGRGVGHDKEILTENILEGKAKL